MDCLVCGMELIDRPIDQSVVVERALPSEAQLDGILDRAVAAQRSWRQTPLADRLAIGAAFVKAFKELGPKIAGDLTLQMGRPSSQGLVEVNGTLDRAKRVLEMAPESLADVTNPVRCSILSDCRWCILTIRDRRLIRQLTSDTYEKSPLVRCSASAHGIGRSSAKSTSFCPPFWPETPSFSSLHLKLPCPANAFWTRSRLPGFRSTCSRSSISLKSRPSELSGIREPISSTLLAPSQTDTL